MITSRVHSMGIEDVRIDGVPHHVHVCSCSWESRPFVNRFDAVLENCAVMEAEIDGARRRRDRRRIQQRSRAA